MPGKGRRFERGNKFGRGRPRGSRNKTTLAAQALFDTFAEPVTRTCLRGALQGDPKLLQICIDRIVPARRDLPIRIGKLAVGNAAELARASEIVTQQVAKGQLSVAQGQAMMELIDKRRKFIETQDLDQRLRAVEGRQ